VGDVWRYVSWNSVLWNCRPNSHVANEASASTKPKFFQVDFKEKPDLMNLADTTQKSSIYKSTVQKFWVSSDRLSITRRLMTFFTSTFNFVTCGRAKRPSRTFDNRFIKLTAASTVKARSHMTIGMTTGLQTYAKYLAPLIGWLYINGLDGTCWLY